MNLNRRPLVLVLIMASSLFGCKGMWNDFFGGGASGSQKALGIQPGSLETCTPPRDPAIASKLANNVSCSADSQCPVGSFCTGNGVSGTCIRECGDGLPNCTGQRYCSCQGVCENISSGGIDGGGGSTPATCDRNDSRLQEIKNDPAKYVACQYDDFCPNGSYCNLAIGRCDWDCSASVPCASGLSCNCAGHCEDPDAGATLYRRKFGLTVSPPWVPVTPGSTNAAWVRTLEVTLRTSDKTLLGGSGSTRPFVALVSVHPGSSLHVACNSTGSPDYKADGCEMGGTAGDAWQFTQVGDMWMASKTITMTPSNTEPPDPGAVAYGGVTVGPPWAISVYCELASPENMTIPVMVGPAKNPTTWDEWPSFDFSQSDQPQGYKGVCTATDKHQLLQRPANPVVWDAVGSSTAMAISPAQRIPLHPCPGARPLTMCF